MTGRWIVDGNNVVGARPDGWWQDRPGAMARLVRLLNGFHEATGDEVLVVFDGRERGEVVAAAGPHVSVRFAPYGDDDEPADAVIAELVAAAADPGRLTVVSSDREVAERARAAAVRVLGAGTFRDRLEALASS